MKVEFKNSAGESVFYDAPDDAVSFVFYMGYLTYKVPNYKTYCNDNILADPVKLDKFLERTANLDLHLPGKAIKIAEGLTYVGPVTQVK